MMKPDSSSTRGARRVGRSPRPRRREASRRPERSGAHRGPTPRPRGRGRAYDSNGNPTSVSQNTAWRFSSLAYDNANRLRQIVSSKTDNYWYNHVGLRVKKTEDATGTWLTTYTLFAGNNPLLQEAYNASGRVQTTFNLIVDDKILAQYKKVYPSAVSNSYFYVDHLNSRRVVFNSTPAVVDRYRYSAWGVVTQDVGTDALASYTGKDYDATGLIYFNARYYDPLTGRFLTEDPSRNGGNWYSYCENSPVNYTDPTGLKEAIGAFDAEGDNPAERTVAALVKTSDTQTKSAAALERKGDSSSAKELRVLARRNAEVAFIVGKAYESGLTLEMANKYYRSGYGAPLWVPLNSLDLSKVPSIPPSRQVSLLGGNFSSLNDGLVYGTLTLFPGEGKTVIGGFDIYGFDIKPWSVETSARNVGTLIGGAYAGSGTPYRIILFGTATLGER